ncbi:hypothetical protein COV04_04495 [Candidatus Uhrbacteria bacterium CG10_big_fil_rev_8_21_14_0_10_48_11]|uniref:Methyltransferase domain-containing protein n=1 Tax=Candidatus Uhrbacteria bacterium CG10_big_fil_rev_8_21_14_0_10_48_11 TaxID=1975037 RepID=A0A2M8LDK9_9BACT|nr:MAG: hypothetical protein COV04_04495 [Candidatus Uhrbacteria bacterium CG10_big_fil_rev_8_21_14_0_10_48_11]
MTKDFWDEFYNQPLEHIPWQGTQADWFQELVDKEVLVGKSAIDVGCGTGAKTRYLARHGSHEVLGFDISPKAIALAKKATETKLSGCAFVVGGAAAGRSFWIKKVLMLYLIRRRFTVLLQQHGLLMRSR